MKQIELTHDYFVIVDDADFDYMNQWNWYIYQSKKKHREGEQFTSIRIFTELPDRTTMEFGQTLLKFNPETHFISFINHNRLDFRRENLKLIPIEYFNYHSSSRKNTSSKYRGVHFSKSKNGYIACLNIDGKKHYIGQSQSEDEAARMYNEYTKKLFGEYAYQNIIGEDNSMQIIQKKGKAQPRKQKFSKEKFKGISERSNGKFTATIKGEFLGTFKTKEDAAYAYNQRAIELYGEHAVLNDLPKGFVGAKPESSVSIYKVFGKEFEGYKEIANHYKISYSTLMNRIRKMPIEEAIQLGAGKGRFKLEGVSMREIARTYGINRFKLSKLLKENYTLEEAIDILLEKDK